MQSLAPILAALIATAPVSAQGVDMAWQYENAAPKLVHASQPVRKVKRKSKVYKPLNKERTRVLAFQHRDEPPRPVCAGPVRGVGEQYVSEAGAVDRAIKSWQETVRYDLGEGYMDTKNAQDVQFRCTRSSIGEIAGQVFQRCEWKARPCRPMLTNGSAP